jgi:hypothetical protein
MPLYRFSDPGELREPRLVAAFDGWVDAGSAATRAAERLGQGGTIVAQFDGDALFDYRARRPTLEIRDGRPDRLTWPQLTLRHRSIEDQDVLVLSGAEPDYRWRRFSAELVALARQLGVSEWISLGAIPAAVPHTRPVPVLGTAADLARLREGVQPGPAGLLRVPAAAISVVDLSVSRAGIPAVGYFAQIPHYVSGEYPPAALMLLATVSGHLGITVPTGDLPEAASTLRKRLDAAAAADDTTREYVTRLEGMADEARLPAGDDLIADIERFLRERGDELGRGGRPN